MGQFSDDGQWWWDGSKWLATAQLVLPQLSPTEIEQSGNLEKARARLRNTGWLHWFTDAGCALTWLTLPFLVGRAPDWRAYRFWTLEQLAEATAFLLGPDETILAGEVNLEGPNYVGNRFTRDPAVVVTARHVLIFRIDSFDGQPRWISLASRPSDVRMESRWIFDRSSFRPALIITKGSERWVIGRASGVSDVEAVLHAWRQGAGVPLTLE
jgi:hypothetical protein